MTLEDFELEAECTNAKMRYDARSNPTLGTEPDEQLTEAEERESSLKEAEGSRVWNTYQGSVSTANGKVTNMEGNSHIYLPGPLQPSEEAEFEKAKAHRCC